MRSLLKPLGAASYPFLGGGGLKTWSRGDAGNLPEGRPLSGICSAACFVPHCFEGQGAVQGDGNSVRAALSKTLNQPQ